MTAVRKVEMEILTGVKYKDGSQHYESHNQGVLIRNDILFDQRLPCVH